jgi:hypothetical protein
LHQFDGGSFTVGCGACRSGSLASVIQVLGRISHEGEDRIGFVDKRLT